MKLIALKDFHVQRTAPKVDLAMAKGREFVVEDAALAQDLIETRAAKAVAEAKPKPPAPAKGGGAE